MTDTDVLLLFPPVCFPQSPPLSTPILKAFLEKKGFKVKQKDLNIGFWEQFKKDENLKAIYNDIEKYLSEHAMKKNLSKDEAVFYLQLKCVNSFEEFKEKVLTEKISKFDFNYLKKKFGNTYNDFQQGKNESTLFYHDEHFVELSESQYTLSSKKLFKHCKSKTNKFKNYFQGILDKNLSEFNVPVVGFSLVGPNQVVPALSFASLIKENFPETHITVGGPWCSLLFDVLPEKKELFDLVDSVVFFEGETALAQIADRILKKKPLNGIPNIAFREGEKIIRNKILYDQDLNELPAPNYDGLPLEKYQLKNFLRLQSSRGCFWGKCIFCAYTFLEPKYRERKIELVIEDIKKLKEKYNVEWIIFVDSSMSPSRLEKLAKALIQSKINIKYSCLVRLDKEIIPILKLLKQSGCAMLEFGLESASTRMLKVLDKGILPEKAREILKESKKAGISNKLFLMYGLPTETIEDMQDTLNFAKQNKDSVDFFGPSKFMLEKKSKAAEIKEQLGIKVKEDFVNDLDLGYNFELGTVTKEELKKAKKEFDKLLVGAGK